MELQIKGQEGWIRYDGPGSACVMHPKTNGRRAICMEISNMRQDVCGKGKFNRPKQNKMWFMILIVITSHGCKLVNGKCGLFSGVQHHRQGLLTVCYGQQSWLTNICHKQSWRHLTCMLAMPLADNTSSELIDVLATHMNGETNEPREFPHFPGGYI